MLKINSGSPSTVNFDANLTYTANIKKSNLTYTPSIKKVDFTSTKINSINANFKIPEMNYTYGISNYPELNYNSAEEISTTNDVKDAKKVSAKEVYEKVASTATVGLISLIEGLGQFGGALVDTLGTIGSVIDSKVADLLGQHEYAERLRNDTKAFVEKEHVSGTFDKLYDNTIFGQNIKNNSYGFELTREVGDGVGYVGGIIIASLLTGGVAGGAAGGAAAGGAAAGATATTATAAATTSQMSTIMAAWGATAGFGKGAETAWNDGADYGSGLGYATANALWEGAQFYVGGEINGFSKEGWSALKNVGARIAMDTGDGAAEGFVQPLLKSIYKDGYYDYETGEYIKFDENANFFDRVGGLWNEQGGWKAVGTQALLAGLMSSVGELPNIVKALKGANINPNNLLKDAPENIEIEKIEFSDSELELLEQLNYDDSTALLSNLPYSANVKQWSIEDVSNFAHKNFDNIYGSQKVDEILSGIVIDIPKNPNSNILGYVDTNHVVHLPVNVNEHASYHELMHRFSEINQENVRITLPDNIKEVFKGNPDTIKISGITEYFDINGSFDLDLYKNSSWVNETLTEYLSSRYSDNFVYNSMYGPNNVYFWERIDNAMAQAKYDNNLFNIYLNNDVNSLKKFFNIYSGENSYNDFRYNLWFSHFDTTSVQNIEAILKKIEKNTTKFNIADIFKSFFRR